MGSIGPDHSLSPTAQSVELVPCWNQEGVYGDSSCSKLAQHVHCRNCPVYSAAGAQLLDRSLPIEYRQEWTEHFALERNQREPGHASAVVFRISAEWLALPTQAFQEVTEGRAIHSLPHRQRSIVLGLANVRGELLICVSLGHLLKLKNLNSHEQLRSPARRLLVVNWEESRVAFPVDEVRGPQRFYPQDLKLPPATVGLANSACINGLLQWQKRTIGLLDAPLLFSTLNRNLA